MTANQDDELENSAPHIHETIADNVMHDAGEHGDGQLSGGTAMDRYRTRSIPLNMEDIKNDWDKPVLDAGIAAKTSIIVRVGALDLGAGTGSFRVREMMHRIAYPLGVHVRADVNLTDIEATCTDGKHRLTEVIDLPTTGVNTERIWLLEHFADWFNVNLGKRSLYHAKPSVSEVLVDHLESPEAKQSALRVLKKVREEREREEREQTKNMQRAQRRGYKPPKGQYAVHFEHVGKMTQEVEESNSDEDESTMNPAVLEVPTSGPGTDAKAGPNAQRKLTEGNRHAHTKEQTAEAGVDNTAQHSTPQHSTAPQEQTKGITVRQAHERLTLIEHRKPLYTAWFSGFAAAVACAAFVFLLGGGPYDMIGAFVGAGIGQWLRKHMFAHHLNQFFVTFVAVAAAAFASIGTLRLIGLADPTALQHDTAYIGAMLFVIPGFPIITGGLDIAKLDIPSGVQRTCYTLAIILMATLAGWMVATAVHLTPQGFEPLGLDPLINDGLRFIAAFCGVWGFSVLFNSPQRMCLVAATIGAITDTLRLVLTDFGMPPEAAALLGALLAGLLATAWRSSVRHGFLPPHLGYPRICLTVPSIVIMVPGLYMYRAMFYLGQFDTLHALNWMFRALMVIVCLPIGLAMARVITDKSWRYDV